jgi:probable F420-dependent oxidoreductase
VRVGRLAEELGYDSFWTAEVTGTEAFSLLTAVGAAAPGLGLGTGVIALQLRTPPLAAMAAATLQSLHPERDIFLGVGISSPVVAGRWHGASYGDRPLAQVREYMTLVRECLSGESVSFQGDFYELSRFQLGVRLGERRPKIVVGALNEGMLRLAGEVADGVLLNYLPASHVPWSVKRVREGGDAEILAYVHAGVGDREAALEPARRDLFSYAVVDAYATSFERAGFADEVADVRQRHQAGDRAGAVAAVSERMVDAIDVVGDASTVRATVEAYVEAGVERPILMPLPWGEDRWAVTEATVRAAAS